MRIGHILLIVLGVGFFIILPIVLFTMAFMAATKIKDVKSASGYCALTDSNGKGTCSLSTEDECSSDFFRYKSPEEAMEDCLKSHSNNSS